MRLVAEVMKLGFADRERYDGGPRFVRMPMDTLRSAVYAAGRRRLVREEIASAEMRPADHVPGFDGAVAAGRGRGQIGGSDRRREPGAARG